MLKRIKDFIKTKPRAYDVLNSMRPINGETENWLDQFSKSNNGAINFIQIGANDGLRWDPLRKFILRDQWSGVLIEPLLPVFEMLCENYSYVNNKHLFFENCTISNTSNKTIDFWTYTADFLAPLSLEERIYYLQKSSLEKQQVLNSLTNIGEAESKIQCYKTKCMTLSAIISKYFCNTQVDLIFIDAEGHDDYIIKTIDFEKYKPKAIFYESHNLGSRSNEIENHLSLAGYTINQLEGDTIASLTL